MITTELIAIQEAGKFFPNKPSPATCWRWILKGTRGCRLATVTIGGRRYVTRETIEAFIEATTAAADRQSIPVAIPSAKRQRAIDAANRKLDAAGIKG